jgi:transposase
VTRSVELSGAAWARVEPLMPQAEGRSRPWRDHRPVVEGIVFRYRTGVAWRDLPERFGTWQTVWKRHHRFATDGTWDMLLRVIQSEADAAGRVDWSVSVDSSIVRAYQHSATAKRVVREDRAQLEEHTGGSVDNNNPRCCRDEPADHALGRSRGGLSTKIHAVVDGRGRPLVILLTPGQAGDPPMMLPLLARLRVGRPLGRPRTRPDRVLADKAYSSRAIRTHLRARGIGRVIPEPDDQKAHRKRRGSRGGWPVTYDRNAYRGRNVIERAFNGFKYWRGLATRYDKHATVYRGALVLAAALLWINDSPVSGVGVEHAFGELGPALVRRGDELHENGGALDDVRAGLAEEGEELLAPRLHP